MIKIEVTGHSIAEVSDKLLAIGASLQRTAIYDADNAAREALQAKRDAAKQEVAEEAPVDPIPGPKSAPAVETSESPQTTEEPSTTPVKIAEPSEKEAETSNEKLDFDTDVAPLVLRVVKDKGKPVVQQILEQFGVERASLLDTAQWPELVDALKDAL